MAPSLKREHIVLYALLTALTAVSIDALLPGLREIAFELAPVPPLSTQHVVSLFILGMVFGELFPAPSQMPSVASGRWSWGSVSTR